MPTIADFTRQAHQRARPSHHRVSDSDSDSRAQRNQVRAKWFTAQRQRPLVEGLPPRVQILGAALYSGFIPGFSGAMH